MVISKAINCFQEVCAKDCQAYRSCGAGVCTSPTHSVHLSNTQEEFSGSYAVGTGKENTLQVSFKTRYACRIFREIQPLPGSFFPLEGREFLTYQIFVPLWDPRRMLLVWHKAVATLLKPWNHLLSRLWIGNI